MFNVTVLKLRDIVKYLVGIMIIIGVIVYATRFFAYKSENNVLEKNNQKNIGKLQIMKMGSLTNCFDKTLPVVADVNIEYNQMKKENKKINSENYLEQFLKTEISSIKGLEETEKNNEKTNQVSSDVNNSNVEDKENTGEQINTEKVILASKDNIKTEVVTQNPISENANVQYGNVKIKNQTTYNLTEDILNPNIKIDNKNVLIFHTHSCESYTPSEKYQYTQTGNYRTTDKNYSVIRVGTELENYLKQYNINVIHDTSYHDYPSYTGSYTR